MNTKRLFPLLAIIAITSSAFAQINVIPLSDVSSQIKSNSSMYFLPRTSIEVKTTVEVETTIPGPYARYAEKYLSIKSVPTEKTSNVTISNISVNSIAEPDPSACYIVTGVAANIDYLDNGIIASYNASAGNNTQANGREQFFPVNQQNNSVHFVDFGVKRNFIGSTDTTYKVIEIDSVFQKIPIYNSVIISKDEEQKAEEVANYIIKIRKRLFKVITAQFETETPPSDIKTMVAELHQLEKNYLELFIGKTIKQTQDYTFYYTPNENLTNEKVAMFYITNEDEISETKTESCEPVFLNVENCDYTRNIKQFYSRQGSLKKEKKHGLYYRIPSNVNIAISFDNHTYYKNSVSVPQCGFTTNLPCKLFSNKKLQIFFNEDGSIGKIVNQ